MYLRCQLYSQIIATGTCAGLSSLREYEEAEQARKAPNPRIQVRILPSFSYKVRFVKDRIWIHITP